MKCSNPYKLLKRLLPTLETQGGSFGIVLSKSCFRLSLDSIEDDEYVYVLETIKPRSFGIEEEEVVLSTQHITVGNDKENNVYETMASFLVDSLPKYTVLSEGLQSTALCNLCIAELYIFED